MPLLTERLTHWAATRPGAPAVHFQGQTWSWAEWHERVQRVSGALRRSGIRHGDVVAFLDRNHLSCLEVTLGASAIGAIDAVINARLAPDELLYVLNDCRARLVFVGAELEPTLAALRDRLPGIERVIVVGGVAEGYEAWLDSGQPTGPGDVADDDPALLLYTSGTTGFPKGATLTHANIVAHSSIVSAAFAMSPEDHNLVAMPQFHVGGTSYALLGIHNGVRTTMTRDPDAASLFEAVAAGATHAFLVPAVIAGILAGGDVAIEAMRPLRLLGYGASPCPLPILRRALEVWPQTDFMQVYGATEVAGVVCTLDAVAHRDMTRPDRLASAGTVLGGIEMRVVDPVSLEDASTGELWFRTPQVMAGYWRKPDATAAAITSDGWYRTGDVGRVDDGGFVFIIDRLKDMIISGGENIYSPEVERVLAEHPAVAEVAIIGIPHERWGESVKAIIVPAPGVTLDPDEVIAFCHDRLAAYKCPRSVDVVDVLPRNATGKILKRDLRAPYWAGQDRPV